MSVGLAISWNYRYVKVCNSCDNKALQEFYDEILEKIPNGFRKRRYLWNVIRGKSFYINASRYVIDNIRAAMKTDVKHEKEFRQQKAFQMIDAILNSTSKEQIQTSFIRNIVKTVPLLTIRTIKYLDRERVVMLLNSNLVYTDQYIEPFITKLQKLEETIEDMRILMDNTLT